MASPSISEHQAWGCCGAVLAALALSVCLPIAWLVYYEREYCWFPPEDTNVEVIASACDNPALYSVSPDGKYMIYVTSQSQAWLRNLITGDERPALTTGPFWLSNNWVLAGGIWGGASDEQGEFHVWDVTDDSLTPLQWVHSIEGTTTRLEDATQVFSPEVIEWFRNAEKVYYIPWYSWAIALVPDFKAHPENNYVLASPRSGRFWDPESILTFLNDNQIAYTEISRVRRSAAGVSHDGRFVAQADGFYTADGVKIGPLYDATAYVVGSPLAYGWAYDNSGVYVQYLQPGSTWIFPPAPPKSQPILKLNLPPEYLSPEARQAYEARQAERARRLQNRMRLAVGALVVVGAVGAGVLGRRIVSMRGGGRPRLHR